MKTKNVDDPPNLNKAEIQGLFMEIKRLGEVIKTLQQQLNATKAKNDNSSSNNNNTPGEDDNLCKVNYNNNNSTFMDNYTYSEDTSFPPLNSTRNKQKRTSKLATKKTSNADGTQDSYDSIYLADD
ncbi:myosin-G heavy chain-like isoform X2 [Drosophila ficusphila]|uniref:myosin-G heavy chain-like isoform X2 n=1 Tax=Drosophila ficusphila TaxID=30025 RepID=UPI0007E5CD80|nr:myosin-G heavy chain-like isoform X2 [Drosophila ficusphila]